jgi:BirA family biotin operon repressor/biotin-[acetyl-CoA-carboxylase] ligase
MTTPPPSPIRWPAEALWEALAPSLPGFTVEVLPEIDSSNTELMRRFRGSPTVEPRPEPLLLVAEQQTAGRGRLGRQWQSRRGDSLTFSLGLPLAPADWSGLSLVAGISVADSLEPLSASPGGKPRIGLKWPNDLWLSTPQGERKLAGILVETASWEGLRYVVIGIGINIRAVALDAAQAPATPSALRPPSRRAACRSCCPGLTRRPRCCA